jgi:hypothetical protein
MDLRALPSTKGGGASQRSQCHVNEPGSEESECQPMNSVCIEIKQPAINDLYLSLYYLSKFGPGFQVSEQLKLQLGWLHVQ